MVKDSRIQEYRFGEITPTSGGGHTLYSEYDLNGELIAIEWKSSSTGSIGVFVSGTGEQLLYKKDLSGTNASISYPLVYGVDNTNTTGSPSVYTNRVINNKIFLSGAGFEGEPINYFNVKYR